MAADLKYYEEERWRHPTALVSARPETVQECCKFLFRCFKVDPIKVYDRSVSPPPGKKATKHGDSLFQPGVEPHIALCGGASLLHICHEVAHYVDYVERQRNPPPGRPLWHGPRHRKLVDQMVPMLQFAYPHIRRECGVPI